MTLRSVFCLNRGGSQACDPTGFRRDPGKKWPINSGSGSQGDRAEPAQEHFYQDRRASAGRTGRGAGKAAVRPSNRTGSPKEISHTSLCEGVSNFIVRDARADVTLARSTLKTATRSPRRHLPRSCASEARRRPEISIGHMVHRSEGDTRAAWYPFVLSHHVLPVQAVWKSQL